MHELWSFSPPREHIIVAHDKNNKTNNLEQLPSPGFRGPPEEQVDSIKPKEPPDTRDASGGNNDPNQDKPSISYSQVGNRLSFAIFTEILKTTVGDSRDVKRLLSLRVLPWDDVSLGECRHVIFTIFSLENVVASKLHSEFHLEFISPVDVETRATVLASLRKEIAREEESEERGGSGSGGGGASPTSEYFWTFSKSTFSGSNSSKQRKLELKVRTKLENVVVQIEKRIIALFGIKEKINGDPRIFQAKDHFSNIIKTHQSTVTNTDENGIPAPTEKDKETLQKVLNQEIQEIIRKLKAFCEKTVIFSIRTTNKISQQFGGGNHNYYHRAGSPTAALGAPSSISPTSSSAAGGYSSNRQRLSITAQEASSETVLRDIEDQDQFDSPAKPTKRSKADFLQREQKMRRRQKWPSTSSLPLPKEAIGQLELANRDDESGNDHLPFPNFPEAPAQQKSNRSIQTASSSRHRSPAVVPKISEKERKNLDRKKRWVAAQNPTLTPSKTKGGANAAIAGASVGGGGGGSGKKRFKNKQRSNKFRSSEFEEPINSSDAIFQTKYVEASSPASSQHNSPPLSPVIHPIHLHGSSSLHHKISTAAGRHPHPHVHHHRLPSPSSHAARLAAGHAHRVPSSKRRESTFSNRTITPVASLDSLHRESNQNSEIESDFEHILFEKTPNVEKSETETDSKRPVMLNLQFDLDIEQDEVPISPMRQRDSSPQIPKSARSSKSGRPKRKTTKKAPGGVVILPPAPSTSSR